jgi:hypothetical protein
MTVPVFPRRLDPVREQTIGSATSCRIGTAVAGFSADSPRRSRRGRYRFKCADAVDGDPWAVDNNVLTNYT